MRLEEGKDDDGSSSSEGQSRDQLSRPSLLPLRHLARLVQRNLGPPDPRELAPVSNDEVAGRRRPARRPGRRRDESAPARAQPPAAR